MSHDPQILVLGGTGKTGRRVTDRLRAQGLGVRAASRHGAVRFDWADESTWAPAVDGAVAAYVVQDDARPDLVRPFAELAVARGVERFVLLSARAWADLGDSLEAEEAVRASGAAWTVLRPAWFAQNFAEAPFISDDVATGALPLPTGDGLEPFVDLDDVAEIAAAALTSDRHDGAVYDLSGPRALSWAEALAEIGRASGRDLRHVDVTADEYVAHLVGRGFPAEVATEIGRYLGHIRAGLSAHLSDGVQRALGREPRDFTVYVRDAAAAGAWRV